MHTVYCVPFYRCLPPELFTFPQLYSIGNLSKQLSLTVDGLPQVSYFEFGELTCHTHPPLTQLLAPPLQLKHC